QLKNNGVFVYIVNEKLGTVRGAQGTKLEVDKTFFTSSPYLLDSLYVVGGDSDHEDKFIQDISYYINVAYTHYKPIGVASDAQNLLVPSKGNNLEGVVFATDNPNFIDEFIDAIA